MWKICSIELPSIPDTDNYDVTFSGSDGINFL